MTTLHRSGETSIGQWLALLLAALMIVTVGLVGLNGIDLAPPTNVNAVTTGVPEVIHQNVPAYIEEQIVYGERSATDIVPAADIMPVHLVEAGYFAE